MILSAKKDGRGMLDMLEKMGMIKKIESDVRNEGVYSEQISEEPNEDPVDTAQTDYYAQNELSSSESYTNDTQNDFFSSGPASSSDSSQDDYSEETANGVSPSFWNDSDHETVSTDKFVDIETLYASFGLPAKGTNTIYIIDEYLKTLPDSLPTESKRSIVMKIVSASGFDFDKLLNDGIDRISRLNEYAASFSAHTDELLSKYNAEIEALEKQIAHVKEIIAERKNLHKRQFLAIDSEAQRLKEILDFITK